MKVFITGAGGMLGSDLAAALHDSFQVSGAGRRSAPHLNIPYHQCDLLKTGAVQEIFKKEEPEVVFHCAAMTQVDGCEKDRAQALALNLEMTEKVIEACNAVGAFLIFFSTDYVFDGKKHGEYRENDPVQPLNVYGETKALAENAIREKAKQYAIFRVSWLYGIHGPSFPRTILERAQQQKEFNIVSDQIGRPTFTRNLAETFCQMLMQQKPILNRIDHQIFHLANAGQTSWADFARFLLKHAGLESVMVYSISSDQLDRPAKRPANSVLSLEKAESSLHLALKPWPEAALEFIREFAIISRSKGLL